MPKKISLPVYFDFSKTKKNTLLIEAGEFVGATVGSYGDNFNFYQAADDKHIVISGGKLRWLQSQNKIIKGGVYNVIFLGKGKMETGNYKGKDVNNYDLEYYSNKEIEELKIKYPNWDKMYECKVPEVEMEDKVLEPSEQESELDDLV